MNTAESIAFDTHTGLFHKTFSFPSGLFEFESVKEFDLISEPDHAPFLRLQIPNNPNRAFIVISPFEVLIDYQPDIPAGDLETLGITAIEDTLLLCIVTLKGKGLVTANLKAPVVINRRTATARQVILANAARYALEQPMRVTEP